MSDTRPKIVDGVRTQELRLRCPSAGTQEWVCSNLRRCPRPAATIRGSCGCCERWDVLVTGGAGFVGAASASRWLRGTRLAGRRASTTSAGAAPSSTCRGCARPASSSSTATSASASDLLAVGRGRRDRRVLRRAVRARRARRRARLRRPDEPGRRLQLPGACAPRRRAVRLPLDEPRLPVAALERLASRGRDPLRAGSRSSRPGRVGGGHLRGFPLEGARTLYGATKLAAELLVAEYAERSACAPSSTAAG